MSVLLLVFFEASIENCSMRQSLLVSIIGGLVSIFLLLTSAGPARSQEGPQPSRNPAVFKAQLLEFILLERTTLREIQALPVDDSIPVDPQVRGRAHQAYSLIRAARWGMELAMERQTYQDPILALAHKRVDVAWNLARFPVDNTSIPRREYISRSVQDMSRAIQLVNQALALLP